MLSISSFALWAKPAAIWFYLFGPGLFFLSVFLIFLILIQRGRGGGLSGALGGMGGQSAFGHKTGDIFTAITVVTTTLWFLLSMLAIGCLQDRPKLDLSDEPALRTPKGADKAGAGATGADTNGTGGTAAGDGSASEAEGASDAGTAPDSGAASSAEKKRSDGPGEGSSTPAGSDKAPEKKSP